MSLISSYWNAPIISKLINRRVIAAIPRRVLKSVRIRIGWKVQAMIKRRIGFGLFVFLRWM